MQLFVDAGVPIDDHLVSALIKEVISEKISTAFGQMTSVDSEEMMVPKAQSSKSQPKPPSLQPQVSKQPSTRVESPPLIVSGNFLLLQ